MDRSSPKKLSSYIIGFVSSVVLTLAAYELVLERMHGGQTFSPTFLIAIILSCAVIQFILQLIFFLHLGGESGPRWKLAIFLSAIGIVLIVVVGSIWIMNHLNYNMMASPQEMQQYIQSQDGL